MSYGERFYEQVTAEACDALTARRLPLRRLCMGTMICDLVGMGTRSRKGSLPSVRGQASQSCCEVTRTRDRCLTHAPARVSMARLSAGHNGEPGPPTKAGSSACNVKRGRR